jgi:hypothetical protein
MVCYKSCYIAFIFLIASLYISLKTDKEGIIKPFVDKLTTEQKINYNIIRNNRHKIYTNGLMYGFVISIIIGVSLYSIGMYKNLIFSICFILSTMLVFSYLYYIITPKKSIINELDNKEQRDAWFKVYRHMQVNYHIGLGLGIIGGGIYGLSICRK